MALKPCYCTYYIILKNSTDFSRGMYGVKNNHNTVYTVVLCSLSLEARSPFVLKHTTSY